MATVQKKVNQIWALYNHMPGGNIVAIHFEDIVRKRRDGNRESEQLITAKDQIDSFKKSPQVALNIRGKIVKNEMLVYQGTGDLLGNPNAADVAIDWAIQQGMQPIVSPSAKGDQPKTYEYDARMKKIEDRQDDMDGKLDKILEAVSEPKK